MPWEKLVNNKLLLFTVGLLVVYVCLHSISVIKNTDFKKKLVLFISCGLFCYLDPVSFFLLLAVSSLILKVVKSSIDLKKNIYPLSLLCIVIVLTTKDFFFSFSMDKLYVPLGISYYSFRLISFIIDSTKDSSVKEIRCLDFYTWIFFFPLLLAGPIQRYVEFDTSPKDPKEYDRSYYFLTLGIVIKLILINKVLYPLSYDYFQTNAENTGGLLWVSAFGLSAFYHAYLDLMIYTLISNSLSGILGFKYVTNFNRPLLASNISQFWNSYHMSLSGWTRDYIFFPTLIKTKNVWLSTYLSMFTLGLWHSINWNWAIWAFCHGTAINAYGKLKSSSFYKKTATNETGKKALRYCGNFVTIYFVGLVFVFVASPDLDTAIRIIQSLI